MERALGHGGVRSKHADVAMPKRRPIVRGRSRERGVSSQMPFEDTDLGGAADPSFKITIPISGGPLTTHPSCVDMPMHQFNPVPDSVGSASVREDRTISPESYERIKQIPISSLTGTLYAACRTLFVGETHITNTQLNQAIDWVGNNVTML